MSNTTATTAEKTSVWVIATDRGYRQTPEIVGIYESEQDAKDSLGTRKNPDAAFWRICELPLGKFLGFHWDYDVPGFSAFQPAAA